MQRKEKVPLCGFTLVELLTAITILAVVMSMTYTILISTLNARKTIEKINEIDKVGSRLSSLIMRDLQAIYFYNIEEPCLVAKIERHGSHFSSHISFVTTNDSFVSSKDIQSDLCEVSYFLKQNKDEPNVFWLVRREEFFVDENPLEGGTLLRLYDRVLNFKISFYNAKGIKKETWNSKDEGMPLAIEIDLGLSQAPKGSSPEVLKNSVRNFKIHVPIIVSSQIPKEKEEKKGPP